MNVEFFVHGVPHGEKFWGKEEERSFLGMFYNDNKEISSDKQLLLIQARKQYFYYSYLVYAGVVDDISRPGSYFGMTLRFTAYCLDFMVIYRILDTAFHSYVMGKLMVVNGAKLKYTAPSFDGFDIKGIEQKVFELLNNALTNSSFSNIGIPSSIGGQCRKWNLYDCTEESVMADIRQYGKIAISPYYPNIKESSMQQQCDSKINTIQQQCRAQINEIMSACDLRERTANDTISSLRNQITQLSTSVQQKSTKIDELERKVKDLDSALARACQNKNIDELIEQIRQPVSSLADILNRRSVVYQPKKGKEGGDERGHGLGRPPKHTPHKLYYVIGFIIIVFAVVLVFFKFCGKKRTHADYTEPVKTEMYDNESYASGKKPYKEETEEDDVPENTAAEKPFPTDGTFDINQVKIDIKEISSSNEKLRLGQTYTVEARYGSETGYWKVEGCTIEYTEKSNVIKIVPTEGKVTITYCAGGNEKPRSIEAI